MKRINDISEIKCLKHAIRMTDENCKFLLKKMRWNGVPKCPKCGSEKNYFLKTRELYKCANKDCYKQFSITTDTIFHNTKLPLSDWFAAMWLFASEKRGLSSVQLAEHLNIEQKTAWFLLQRIREAVNDSNGFILNGTVEIDEAYCGARLSRDKRVAFKANKRKEERISLNAEGPREKVNRIASEQRKKAKGNKLPVRKNNYYDLLSTVSNEQRIMLQEDDLRRKAYQPFFYSKVILGLRERDEYDYIIHADGTYEVVRTKVGRIRLVKLGKHAGEVNSHTIVPLLKQMIEQDSRIITDSHPAYVKALSNHFRRHDKVVHSNQSLTATEDGDDMEDTDVEHLNSNSPFEELNSELATEHEVKTMKRKKGVQYVVGDKYTNNIENSWLHLKKMENGTYFHFSWKYTDRYLNEFSFRFNSRHLQNFEKFAQLFSGAFVNKISMATLKGLDDEYNFVPR
ncbi:MAG: IS1595 family transposase [Flavobacteriales bacterium]|nr:IS1595 family transposase [Flavobacteriales bacterium]